jgi:hypothetical protein
MSPVTTLPPPLILRREVGRTNSESVSTVNPLEIVGKAGALSVPKTRNIPVTVSVVFDPVKT